MGLYRKYLRATFPYFPRTPCKSNLTRFGVTGSVGLNIGTIIQVDVRTSIEGCCCCSRACRTVGLIDSFPFPGRSDLRVFGWARNLVSGSYAFSCKSSQTAPTAAVRVCHDLFVGKSFDARTFPCHRTMKPVIWHTNWCKSLDYSFCMGLECCGRRNVDPSKFQKFPAYPLQAFG